MRAVPAAVALVVLAATMAGASAPIQRTPGWRVIEFSTGAALDLSLWLEYDGPILASIDIFRDGRFIGGTFGGGSPNYFRADMRLPSGEVQLVQKLPAHRPAENSSIIGVILPEPGDYTAVVMVAGEVTSWRTRWSDGLPTSERVYAEGAAYSRMLHEGTAAPTARTGAGLASVGYTTDGVLALRAEHALFANIAEYHVFARGPILNGPEGEETCPCSVNAGQAGDYVLRWSGASAAYAALPFAAWGDVQMPG